MTKITCKLFIFLTLILTFTTNALSENNQTLVFDLGIGVHFFNEADEFRDSSLFVNNISWLGQIGAEWYVLGNVGFGVRQINILGTSNHLEHKKEYSIQNSLVTVNLVPFGGTDYVRLIVTYGLGFGRYSAREFWEDDEDSSRNYDYSGSVDGNVSLGQIYADWGGEDFGFRAGISYLLTNFEDLELGPDTYEIDGSGFSFCAFSIRYAF